MKPSARCLCIANPVVRGIALAMLLLVAADAGAGPVDYSSDEGVTNFGTLDQFDTGALYGSCSCGPTAAVNSFVYLENVYGSIYGTLLTALNLNAERSVAQTLAREYMHTRLDTDPPDGQVQPGGTYIGDFIAGKMAYIEAMAPNRTTYEAQVSSRVVNAPVTSEGTEVVDPTGLFLAKQLKDGEDVELLVNKFDGSGKQTFGHYNTVIALHWINQAGDGVMHQSDGATMDFIDPVGGVTKSRHVYEDATGLHLVGQDQSIFDITAIVAESPIKKGLGVPEPAGGALTALAIAAMALGRRLAAVTRSRQPIGLLLPAVAPLAPTPS